jgi:hypothetical protein
VNSKSLVARDFACSLLDLPVESSKLDRIGDRNVAEAMLPVVTQAIECALEPTYRSC